MRKNNNTARILAFLLAFMLLLSGCSGSNGGDTVATDPTSGDPVTLQSTAEVIPPPAAPDLSEQRPTRPVTTTVTLADNNIQVEGNGASANGNTLTITADGVYEITGTLADGQIVINAPDKAEVEIVLSGINVSNSKNSAIYCKTATIL